MSSGKPLVGVLLATLLSACAVGPDYQRPALDLPEKWRGGEAGEAGVIDAAWWTQFGDPVLDGLIREALRENLDIRIAAARVDQYLGQLQTTRSAFFPQIGAGASASREQSTEAGVTPFPAGVANPATLYATQFNLAWEIDLFGRIRRATEAARAQALASEEGRRAVILSVTAGVASSYIALRASDSQLDVARATAHNFADTLRIFELRFKGGVISRVELAQVQSQYQKALAAIPVLEQQVAAQENLLSTLLGRNPGPVARGRPIAGLSYPAIPAGLPSSLLERRPDIMRAEAELVAANAQIGMARALYFPTLSLTGAAGSVSAPLSSLFTGPANAWSTGAALAMPLATFGNIAGQVQSAEALERQGVERYRQTVQIALREVNDALTGTQKSRELLAAQGKRVDALREYARLSRLRFDNGLTSYLEVLTAENDLFDAELSLVDAQSSTYGQIINAYKAMGGGWVDTAAKLSAAAAPH